MGKRRQSEASFGSCRLQPNKKHHLYSTPLPSPCIDLIELIIYFLPVTNQLITRLQSIESASVCWRRENLPEILRSGNQSLFLMDWFLLSSSVWELLHCGSSDPCWDCFWWLVEVGCVWWLLNMEKWTAFSIKYLILFHNRYGQLRLSQRQMDSDNSRFWLLLLIKLLYVAVAMHHFLNLLHLLSFILQWKPKHEVVPT